MAAASTVCTMPPPAQVMSLSVTNWSVGASDRTRPSLRTRMPEASQPSTSSTAEREICSSVASSVCSASRSRAIDAMR